MIKIFYSFGFFLTTTNAISDINIVTVLEKLQPEVAGWFTDSLREVQLKTPNAKLDGSVILLDRENIEESSQQLCAAFAKKPSIVLDATWTNWDYLDDLVIKWDFPRIKTVFGDAGTMLDGLMQILNENSATDALMVFQNENVLDQALYRLLGKTVIRILALNNLKSRLQAIKNMRPHPGFYVLFGPTDFIQESYKLASNFGIIHLPDRWIIVITDFRANKLDISLLKNPTTILNMAGSLSCKLQEVQYPCPEDDENLQFNAVLMTHLIQLITNIFMNNNFTDWNVNVDCGKDANATESVSNNQFRINQIINNRTKMNDTFFYWDDMKAGIYLNANLELKVGGNKGIKTIALWESSSPTIQLLPNKALTPPKRYFRIGTIESIPWTIWKRNPVTREKLLTPQGEPVYEGYCIDLIQRLSEVMDFEYDIVTPKFGTFGRKFANGSFDGVIGDLVTGDTDMIVAATIMTSEREEVVDFVAPYFEQTGLTIVMRKPLRKTSLFKFMTVLRVEVWLSILAALSVTAILLSILDKFSPYSARNNKKAYPYPCRDFTLKESFWFALTSFTPQGGGEAPKSLSGRVLVAAYWLFVVLMLATFTANLAAFLTVERMQTPVSSLEQLARQSRINYTVVEGQTAHQYFINMKHAEDTLYRVWKEITLNSTTDQHKYQVWDYPIKEQYGHILLAINGSQPFKTTDEGFRTVDEHEDADFAFIHDSSRIKYEMTKNCNLTMVGDIFGERPYAIAVQQGSHLQEEVSKALLKLQTERFLEGLNAKYWNNTCSNSDDSEGITLDSLGGVFIATLFGLALAMITLAWEVIYYKRKEKKNKIDFNENKTGLEKKLDNWVKPDDNFTSKVKTITLGSSFKPIKAKNKSKISFINTEPKIPWNP